MACMHGGLQTVCNPGRCKPKHVNVSPMLGWVAALPRIGEDKVRVALEELQRHEAHIC